MHDHGSGFDAVHMWCSRMHVSVFITTRENPNANIFKWFSCMSYDAWVIRLLRCKLQADFSHLEDVPLDWYIAWALLTCLWRIHDKFSFTGREHPNSVHSLCLSVADWINLRVYLSHPQRCSADKSDDQNIADSFHLRRSRQLQPRSWCFSAISVLSWMYKDPPYPTPPPSYGLLFEHSASGLIRFARAHRRFVLRGRPSKWWGNLEQLLPLFRYNSTNGYELRKAEFPFSPTQLGLLGA